MFLFDSHYYFLDYIYDESGPLWADISGCGSEPSDGQTTASVFMMVKETRNDCWVIPELLGGQQMQLETMLTCIILVFVQAMTQDRKYWTNI